MQENSDTLKIEYQSDDVWIWVLFENGDKFFNPGLSELVDIEIKGRSIKELRFIGDKDECIFKANDIKTNRIRVSSNKDEVIEVEFLD